MHDHGPRGLAGEAARGASAGPLFPLGLYPLPAVLRPLALQNPKAIYTLLFSAAAESLLQFGEQRLGARLGVTVLLHTWGQNLTEHPHVHGLVTGGGLVTQPGQPPQWRAPKQSRYLFPVQAVAALNRGKFLAGLEVLRSGGTLQFHGRLEFWRHPAVWERTLAALRASKWIVFAKGSVAAPNPSWSTWAATRTAWRSAMGASCARTTGR